MFFRTKKLKFMEIQNNIPISSHLEIQTDQLLTPTPRNKPNKNVLIIIILGLFLVIGIFIYFSVLQGNHGLTFKLTNSNPLKQKTTFNNIVYTNSIAKICSKEKKPIGNYVPGQIVLKFKDNYSVAQIKKYLSDNNYKTANTYSLDRPTNTLIIWTDLFNSQNSVTIDEVNMFLDKVRQENYIQDISTSSFWHDGWPLTKDRANQIQRIDRWGYFTLTFSDPTKEQEFFQKYPEATLYGHGEISGPFLMRKPNIDQVSILYKAKNALDILQNIKAQVKIPDYEIRKSVVPDGIEDQEQVIFLDDSQRDTTNTTYVSNLGIKFPSNLDNNQIHQVLQNYSTSIDLNKTIPDQRSNYITIQVPTSEEECWARELKKEPEIDSAGTNGIGHID